MKRTIFAFLIITLMTFMAYSLFAQDTTPSSDNPQPHFMRMGRMGSGGPGPFGLAPMAQIGDFKGIGMFRPDLMEKIGITKEQKETIQKIVSEHRKDMIKKDADRKLAEVDLQEMLSKEKPDMNLVKNQIQKIASLKADIQFARLKMQMDLKNVLTDEQKAKLEKLMQDQKAEMKEKMKDKGNKNMGRQGPGPMNRQRNK
ncbi:MAG: Spy/CpxP family protein refolding chaperone [Candidatus Poribacteria bacterium]